MKTLHEDTNKCKAHAHTMEYKKIFDKIVMDDLYFSPNKTCQVEEYGISSPLRLFPSTYTQNSLLKEMNEALQKFNYPSISEPTTSEIWNTHFLYVEFSKNTKFSKCSECIMLKS